MQGTAVDTKRLAEMIQPPKLKEQGFPAPDRVSVIFGTDHTGEDAFHVFLVFSDDTPDEVLTWQNIKPMVRWVQDRIWKADSEQHWPYVRVTRHSQLVSGQANVAS